MGDFNFHREAENASIPNDWTEVPAVVNLGPTWDTKNNTMLPHLLPLRNMYNGFGLFEMSFKMRLDRVLVHGDVLDCEAATAELFADKAIHRDGGRPLQAGQLRNVHRRLPWQDYLYASDHYGILMDIPLVSATSGRSVLRKKGISLGGWSCWLFGGRMSPGATAAIALATAVAVMALVDPGGIWRRSCAPFWCLL